MANTGIQHWAKTPGGRPRCGKVNAISSGPILEDGAHWCRRCRRPAQTTLTPADIERIKVALRLRVEAAEENQDNNARDWRETLNRVEAGDIAKAEGR